MSAHHKRNFTLIELLVVIAIIAILASMLLPALNRARDKSRELLCMSNLKNNGLSMQMYASDWDEAYPFQYVAQIGLPYAAQTWADLLYGGGYLKPSPVLVCPALKSQEIVAAPTTSMQYIYGTIIDIPKVAGIDCGLLLKSNNLRFVLGKKVRQSALMPLLVDSIYNDPTDWKQRGYVGWGTGSVAHMRHGRQANFVFLDGHAAAMDGLEYSQTLRRMIQVQNGTQPTVIHCRSRGFADLSY